MRMEPSEPVYQTLIKNEKNKLQYAYNLLGNECKDNLEYTMWKIRDRRQEQREQKHIFDYISHSPQLGTVSTLDMPTEEHIYINCLASLAFA